MWSSRARRLALSVFISAQFNDPFAIAALHTITTLTGSAILALAVAKGEISGEEAWKLAHVDEDWTIEHWGEDAEAAARRAVREREMMAAVKMLEAVSSLECHFQDNGFAPASSCNFKQL